MTTRSRIRRLLACAAGTAVLLSGPVGTLEAQIIIQEQAAGFCAVDGIIESSVAGYTGPGYANGDAGIGKSISWQIDVPSAGTYAVAWRFAVSGGTIAPRHARLVLDGNPAVDTVRFPYTGSAWTSWTISDSVPLTLTAGSHKIRLEALSASGLGNIDYLTVLTPGAAPAVCTPAYVLSVQPNNPAAGTVSYSPVRAYYDAGTLVTVRARANDGWFFQSWTGEETSADTVFTFAVRSNVSAVARFLPAGTTADTGASGYATVQDDRGTPYLLFGGALGATVSAFTVEDLRTYLASPLPYVIHFSGTLTGTDVLTVASDKTLVGVGGTAHLRGIELSVNNARNVIIRNITISHVTPQDALEINGRSKNILIDHCEFSSDRDHGTEYYDGLLDVKNGSSFITVRRSSFHDHYKTILMSSNDESFADSVARITFHHNYFFNCESRLPSIRFGKAHIFNNYYRNCHTAVNSRMGAWVRVERNYFEATGTAVMSEYSAVPGRMQLIDNYFGSSLVTSEPTCDLQVPYPYVHLLQPVMEVPGVVTGTARVTGAEEPVGVPSSAALSSYPNPFNPATTVTFRLPEAGRVRVSVLDLLGREVALLVDETMPAGQASIRWNAQGLASGFYLCRLQTNGTVLHRKLSLVQ